MSRVLDAIWDKKFRIKVKDGKIVWFTNVPDYPTNPFTIAVDQDGNERRVSFVPDQPVSYSPEGHMYGEWRLAE